VSTPPFCRECDGTGWIPYRSETLDGEMEEAYRLCANSCTPRRCIGFTADYPCHRPGTVRYGLGYYCKEHIEHIHLTGGIDNAYKAIYYLRRWLCVTCDNDLLEALGKAETCLGRAKRELD
jgi:hypothetical protein